MSSDIPKIALVDASPDICQLTAMSFDQLGCKVRCWPDGDSAWRNLQRWRPDIGIIDLDLEGIDGFQLGRRLRDLYSMRLLLIATTCVPRSVAESDLRGAGFDEIVGKPYNVDDLVAAMERAVAISDGRLRRVA